MKNQSTNWYQYHMLDNYVVDFKGDMCAAIYFQPKKQFFLCSVLESQTEKMEKLIIRKWSY